MLLVSSVQQSHSVIYILSGILFRCRLLQDIDYSSLWEAAFDLDLKGWVGFGLAETREENFPEEREEGHSLRNRGRPV